MAALSHEMATLAQLAASAAAEAVDLPELAARGVELSVWRLDRLDAAGSGNKLFKLAEHLRAAAAAGQRRVLSFGGAYSNHIHALAAAGAAAGLATVGVIRGEPAAADNPTLRDARAAGMELHFVPRDWYRRHADGHDMPALRERFGDCYVIPEGGAGPAGALGCRVLGEAIGARAERPDLVVLPCGTGATLAGLVAGLADACAVLGVAVLKGGDFLREAVQGQLEALGAGHRQRWAIDTEHHGGGYAKVAPALAEFSAAFSRRTGIPVEPVYTGKMLHALWQDIEQGRFARGTRLLALHTGGLQGARRASATDQPSTGPR